MTDSPQARLRRNLHRVARAEGVRKFSTPIGLDNIVPVDLIVVGSVAVSKDGYRIGKGEGYADLEYAMARGAGAVSEETLVITTVHDDQVFDYLPPELFGAQATCTVDMIVTHRRRSSTVSQRTRQDRPGIIWNAGDGRRKLKAIPILKALREVEQGVEYRFGRQSADEEPGRRPRARRDRPPIDHADGLTVLVRRIPSDARPRDLREAIVAADSPATILSWKGRQGAAGAIEPTIAWKGRRGMAFVRLRSAEAAAELVANADKLRTISDDLVVERYKGRERDDSDSTQRLSRLLTPPWQVASARQSLQQRRQAG
ncbi:methenyltetrahydrofolate synthase domain-containing protein-like [Pollicipes pollicipes]|uniref:methenyltetrahydrofolate synthase domain-containing protein-like n=1 Tax=Pollicipes pollicipes TaxID=41117 RepID=UPI0018853E8D|nr:methenyltetrahydrofolate synthase domain-containing protein-like [Pollicipes pollicipes]